MLSMDCIALVVAPGCFCLITIGVKRPLPVTKMWKCIHSRFKENSPNLRIKLAAQMEGILVDIICRLLSAVDAQDKHYWIASSEQDAFFFLQVSGWMQREASPVVKVVETRPLRMAFWAACRCTVYSVVSESPSRRIHVSSASTISSCTWVPEGGRHQEQQMRKAMGSLKSKMGKWPF